MNFTAKSFEISQFPRAVGASLLNFIQLTGSLVIFIYRVIFNTFSKKFYWQKFLTQLLEIGFYSLPLIALTAIFTGAVLALQSYNSFARFNAHNSIPIVVAISLARELSPVLAGLMVSGRIASSIASEIGSMQVGNQIAAMQSLLVNPFKYLVVPRILAGIICLPILTMIMNILGYMGGFMVCVFIFKFSAYSYINIGLDFLSMQDINSGLIKGFFFGLILTLIGSYCGYATTNGTQGVGRSTTNAVIVSSIMILLLNYILTAILF